MSLQVLAKACEREVVETVPTAPLFLEGDVGLEARDLWNGMVFKGKAFSLRSICKLFLQNRPILAVVCGVEGKGATLWTSFSSPDAKLCTTAQGDAMEAVKRFFFFCISHQSFPPTMVGDVFLEHTSVASHALAAFENIFFSPPPLLKVRFDPTSPRLKSQHDCTYHPARWYCGVFFASEKLLVRYFCSNLGERKSRFRDKFWRLQATCSLDMD